MTRLNVNDARCVALFASGLQPSDAPAPEAPTPNALAPDALAPDVLAGVISRTVRQFGIAGCAARMAQEFGDHPEAAASRMRWIRQLIGGIYTPAATRPAPLSGRPLALGSGPRAARPVAGRAHRAA